MWYYFATMGGTLRTQEGENKYKEYRENGGLNEKCVLCSKSAIEAFTYWKVISNDFPYDFIAKTHMMIVPLRHIKEEFLTEEEKSEFQKIKENYIQEYDYIIEATYKAKSIPEHFHLHLIICK